MTIAAEQKILQEMKVAKQNEQKKIFEEIQQNFLGGFFHRNTILDEIEQVYSNADRSFLHDVLDFTKAILNAESDDDGAKNKLKTEIKTRLQLLSITTENIDSISSLQYMPKQEMSNIIALYENVENVNLWFTFDVSELTGANIPNDTKKKGPDAVATWMEDNKNWNKNTHQQNIDFIEKHLITPWDDNNDGKEIASLCLGVDNKIILDFINGKDTKTLCAQLNKSEEEIKRGLKKYVVQNSHSHTYDFDMSTIFQQVTRAQDMISLTKDEDNAETIKTQQHIGLEHVELIKKIAEAAYNDGLQGMLYAAPIIYNILKNGNRYTILREDEGYLQDVRYLLQVHESLGAVLMSDISRAFQTAQSDNETIVPFGISRQYASTTGFANDIGITTREHGISVEEPDPYARMFREETQLGALSDYLLSTQMQDRLCGMFGLPTNYFQKDQNYEYTIESFKNRYRTTELAAKIKEYAKYNVQLDKTLLMALYSFLLIRSSANASLYFNGFAAFIKETALSNEDEYIYEHWYYTITDCMQYIRIRTYAPILEQTGEPSTQDLHTDLNRLQSTTTTQNYFGGFGILEKRLERMQNTLTPELKSQAAPVPVYDVKTLDQTDFGNIRPDISSRRRVVVKHRGREYTSQDHLNALVQANESFEKIMKVGYALRYLMAYSPDKLLEYVASENNKSLFSSDIIDRALSSKYGSLITCVVSYMKTDLINYFSRQNWILQTEVTSEIFSKPSSIFSRTYTFLESAFPEYQDYEKKLAIYPALMIALASLEPAMITGRTIMAPGYGRTEMVGQHGIFNFFGLIQKMLMGDPALLSNPATAKGCIFLPGDDQSAGQIENVSVTMPWGAWIYNMQNKLGWWANYMNQHYSQFVDPKTGSSVPASAKGAKRNARHNPHLLAAEGYNMFSVGGLASLLGYRYDLRLMAVVNNKLLHLVPGTDKIKLEARHEDLSTVWKSIENTGVTSILALESSFVPSGKMISTEDPLEIDSKYNVFLNFLCEKYFNLQDIDGEKGFGFTLIFQQLGLSEEQIDSLSGEDITIVKERFKTLCEEKIKTIFDQTIARNNIRQNIPDDKRERGKILKKLPKNAKKTYDAQINDFFKTIFYTAINTAAFEHSPISLMGIDNPHISQTGQTVLSRIQAKGHWKNNESNLWQARDDLTLVQVLARDHVSRTIDKNRAKWEDDPSGNVKNIFGDGIEDNGVYHSAVELVTDKKGYRISKQYIQACIRQHIRTSRAWLDHYNQCIKEEKTEDEATRGADHHTGLDNRIANAEKLYAEIKETMLSRPEIVSFETVLGHVLDKGIGVNKWMSKGVVAQNIDPQRPRLEGDELENVLDTKTTDIIMRDVCRFTPKEYQDFKKKYPGITLKQMYEAYIKKEKYELDPSSGILSRQDLQMHDAFYELKNKYNKEFQEVPLSHAQWIQHTMQNNILRMPFTYDSADQYLPYVLADQNALNRTAGITKDVFENGREFFSPADEKGMNNLISDGAKDPISFVAKLAGVLNPLRTNLLNLVGQEKADEIKERLALAIIDTFIKETCYQSGFRGMYNEFVALFRNQGKTSLASQQNRVFDGTSLNSMSMGLLIRQLLGKKVIGEPQVEKVLERVKGTMPHILAEVSPRIALLLLFTTVTMAVLEVQKEVKKMAEKK